VNPFDDADGRFVVLVNDERQYSLWPAAAEMPPGWAIAFGAADRMSCADFIRDTWADLRPLRLRHSMEGPGSPAEAAGAPTAAVLFEAQVKRTPQAIAVTDNRNSLTYAELNASANRLAHRLIQHGARPERLVAFAGPRDIHLVTTVLAILKAGSGYLPVDDCYPRARTYRMLREARPVVLLATGSGVPSTTIAEELGIPRLDPSDIEATGEVWSSEDPTDADRAAAVDRRQVAYTLFTSGSTGLPKGVVISHENMSYLLSWAAGYFGAEGLAHVLLTTSLNFDVSVFELFCPLVCGGTVEVLENALALAQRPAGAAVPTVISGVPSVLAQLAVIGQLRARADTVALCGEAVSARQARAIKEGAGARRLLNIYGPTEATVYATSWPDDGLFSGPPPIGDPLPGAQAFILDDELRPVTGNAVGELYLGGAGVARGYLNRPDLTAERFIACPFDAGRRMYRTGDLARRNTDGTLAFEGRVDDQIKVNGFRIEPAEVQATLEEHEAVEHSAVVAQRDGDAARLVGYVVARQPWQPETESLPSLLRKWLSSRLPAYMVPSAVVVLQHLPLTSNGKLDRSALSSSQRQERAQTADREQPDSTHSLLTEVGELLGRPAVRMDEDLLEAGMSSLDALRLAVHLATRWGTTVRLADVFRARTMRALHDLAAARPRPASEVSTGADAERAPLTRAQQRSLVSEHLHPGDLDNVVVEVYRIDGPVDVEALNHAVQRVVIRHHVLRTIYPLIDGTPVAQLVPADDLRDLLTETAPAPDPQTLADRCRQDGTFRLDTDPPIRFWISRTAVDEHLLAVAAHHIAIDGRSLQILVQDLRTAYADVLAGLPPRPAPALDYADYAVWEQRNVQAWIDADLEYWRQILTTAPASFFPAATTEAVSRYQTLRLDSGTVDALTRAANRHGGPPVSALVATVLAALRQVFPGRDALLGIGSDGRADRAFDDVVGYFANPVAVRVTGDRDDLLTDTAEAVVGALEHATVPYNELVRLLRPSAKWFPVMVVLQEPLPRGPFGPDAFLTTVHTHPRRTRRPITIQTIPVDGAWELAIDTNTDLIDDTTAEHLLDHLHQAATKLSK